MLLSTSVHQRENITAHESYCSQLWIETERDGDHQAQNERNTYVTEGSDQQRLPLEKSCSVKENLLGKSVNRRDSAHVDRGAFKT